MPQFYVAIIEKTRGGFGVFFPDLPGCTSFGPTIAKAAENAYVAAQAHAALTQEYGEDLPKARPPEQIAADPDVQEKARLLVPLRSEKSRCFRPPLWLRSIAQRKNYRSRAQARSPISRSRASQPDAL